MDNVFKYFNGFFKGLTGLIMTVLGLGVAVEILFGGGGNKHDGFTERDRCEFRQEMARVL